MHFIDLGVSGASRCVELDPSELDITTRDPPVDFTIVSGTGPLSRARTLWLPILNHQLHHQMSTSTTMNHHDLNN